MKSTLFFLLLFSGRFICITFVSVGGVCGLLAGGAVYAVSSASLICSSCISSSPFLVGKGMCILPSGTTSDSLFFLPFILSFFSSSFTRDSGCLLLLLLGQWKALVRKSAHGLLSVVLGGAEEMREDAGVSLR